MKISSELNAEVARDLLFNMMRIRKMEELCAELYTQEKIRGFLHLYIGEEAVATGVLAHINQHDNVVATYREHAHALLKGLSANEIMAEMFGKVTGCSRGRGGSMHLFSKKNNFFGGNAIVGAGLPTATGLAVAVKYKKENNLDFQNQTEVPLTICFFGEGAIAEGVFHETMNLASLWDVPLIFCCENNLYAMGTALNRSEAQTDLIKKVESYNIKCISVNGMDVESVFNQTALAIDYVREIKKPFFIEFKTYRFKAHSMFDPDLYREKNEIESWKERCPIEFWKSKLYLRLWLNDKIYDEMKKKIEIELASAVNFAESSSLEPTIDLTRYLYAEKDLTEGFS